GGSCPFLQEVEGGSSLFCGFTTSTTGTPNNCWGMYTGGFGKSPFPFAINNPTVPLSSSIFPFDTTTYFEYNSIFTTETSVTCIRASAVRSAICSGYQAADYDGAHALTIPVLSGLDVQARLGNWGLGTSLSPGFITAFGGGYSASANFFEWLNAYSSNPAIAGTFRQSFLTAVDSLSPWNERSVWDAYLLSNIYDSLFVQNPLCTSSASLAATAGVTQCSS